MQEDPDQSVTKVLNDMKEDAVIPEQEEDPQSPRGSLKKPGPPPPAPPARVDALLSDSDCGRFESAGLRSDLSAAAVQHQ